MSDKTSYSGTLGEWQLLQTSIAGNSHEIPHLEAIHALFTESLIRTQELARQQAELAAEKQRHSQQIKLVIASGQRLATMLRQGVKQHYGIRSEKLAEFGMQPFRGRNFAVKTETTPPTAEATIPSAE